MKLKNKNTREIVDFRYLQSDYVAPLVLTTYENDKPKMYRYNSLAELNEEWEDGSEEPKVGYIIDPMEEDCVVTDDSGYEEPDVERAKEIGIWFETREEAKKAVEKLKAWKRLKNKNFHFLKYSALGYGEIEFSLDFEDMDDEGEIGELKHDLDLLFGGEE